MSMLGLLHLIAVPVVDAWLRMQIIAIRANSVSVEAAKSALNYTVVMMVLVRSGHNIDTLLSLSRTPNGGGPRRLTSLLSKFMMARDR